MYLVGFTKFLPCVFALDHPTTDARYKDGAHEVAPHVAPPVTEEVSI